MSVFQEIPSTEWVASNALAFAIRDRFPVSPGHSLIITRRLVPDWFAATAEERVAIFALVDEVKRALDENTPRPDGYNVGFNAQPAAGQTVMHLHVHVIPRYRGDMDDPRGGVRHVIPSKGNYLRQVAPLATGGIDPFAQHLLPLFDHAREIDILAAFVQLSGVQRIRAPLWSALVRGARVRILTGDYLNITQAEGLEMLLDWQHATAGGKDDAPAGTFEARVIEVASLPRPTRSFHPKSWSFESEAMGVAFVGSSNLSWSALEAGIEWNLRVDRDRDAEAYSRVRAAFESTWRAARVLDSAWIAGYEKCVRATPHPLPQGEIDADVPQSPPDPHPVQLEALEKLRAARQQGRKSALVVLATGLGKTWLAAFDYRQLREEVGRRPRLLFLAHRRELLRQAATTYRRLLRDIDPTARVGWCSDEDDDLAADLVFASVAKLARPAQLAQLRAQSFDYVVVDEVHHASAKSYRDIFREITPGFLLGITATPERADAADIMGLFDDFVAYRADISRGVELGRLTPFHYYGVKDEIDYENIPWRNRRFDPEALAIAAQTEARMNTMWRAWQEHPGKQSLVFCCSIPHADHVRRWLRKQGVRVNAVYAAPGSDDRETSLAALERGELDAVCAVDVFNEGVDVPSIDRVMMLRPTESNVVFLQQLGRGLRACEGKTAVTVVDFVGNHRVFLDRLRALLSLASGASSAALRQFLASTSELMLPAGCSVDLELEAKELLSRLFAVGGADEVERAYREIRLERGERPTAGELQRMGYLPSRLRERHGSWFEYVHSEKDLAAEESAALVSIGGFLRELETTEMTKSFKMVTVEAILEGGALIEGMPLPEVAQRSHALLRRSPELFADIVESERHDALSGKAEASWLAYWRRNPIAAWTDEKKGRRTWFRIVDGRLVLNAVVDATLVEALTAMAQELVDYRLAQYRARRRLGASAEGFVCRVLWNQRDPILKLPNRKEATLPDGETDVRVPDGSVWQFRFAREFCNIARPAGTMRNQLPDLLRRWFGPRAGQPGTAFDVRFHASPDSLWVEPVQAMAVEVLPLHGIVAYPDLPAAAGHANLAVEALDADRVLLPVADADPDLFAVRAAGTSMDGGKAPLRNGDWAVMRYARGTAAGALENRVVLVQVPGEAGGHQYQLKRLERRDNRWILTSDNPTGPTIEPRDDMTVLARLDRVVQPEQLAPHIGTFIAADDLAMRFGIEDIAPRSGRHGGHLFVFIDEKGLLIAPDHLRYTATHPRAAETAFVLSRASDGRWCYLGVARQTAEVGIWSLPSVDFATWRTWGHGREVSRPLPDGAMARAQLAVDALLAMPEKERLLTQGNGKRGRVLGMAQRGGIRVDGGKDGFAERTVSLQDIAWIVVADEDVRAQGGLLDDERVNRLRYLEGTPKASTQWIDTGWAIAAWNVAKSRIREGVAADAPLHQIRGDSGKLMDASFRVDPRGDSLAIIYESRGGARGTKAMRNSDYGAGLEVLLTRLGQAGLLIEDVFVESRDTESVPSDERRVAIPGETYPIAIMDSVSLRKKISVAQAAVGRAQGAKGSGNSTRRLCIFVRPAEGAIGQDNLVRLIESRT